MYCPHCSHCQEKIREVEVARKKRLEEERAEEERRKEVERQRDLKWGLKYGHDYKRYTIEDIKHIYDEEFLTLLGLKFWGPAQPRHWFEEQYLKEFTKEVDCRLEELKSNPDLILSLME